MSLSMTTISGATGLLTYVMAMIKQAEPLYDVAVYLIGALIFGSPVIAGVIIFLLWSRSRKKKSVS